MTTNPRHPDGYHLCAERALGAGRISEAVELFTQTASLDGSGCDPAVSADIQSAQPEHADWYEGADKADP